MPANSCGDSEISAIGTGFFCLLTAGICATAQDYCQALIQAAFRGGVLLTKGGLEANVIQKHRLRQNPEFFHGVSAAVRRRFNAFAEHRSFGWKPRVVAILRGKNAFYDVNEVA